MILAVGRLEEVSTTKSARLLWSHGISRLQFEWTRKIVFGIARAVAGRGRSHPRT